MTNTTQAALRQQFEAAYVAAYPNSSMLDPAQFHREDDGQYERVQVQTAWTLYCAALAAQAVPAIPDAIMQVIRNLHTQDNRITESPFFAVQQKRRIYGLDPDYCDNSEWVLDSETITLEEGEDPPADARKVGYIDIWEFVTGCLTEAGCKAFIACNGHNLREPRIYAYGSFRNAEWKSLRAWLMSLNASPAPAEAKEEPKLHECGFPTCHCDDGRCLAQEANDASPAPAEAKEEPEKAVFDLATFNRRFREVATARGKTMKAVASETGVSETTLSRMQNEGRAPDAASLVALSAWAGIDPGRCRNGAHVQPFEAPAPQPQAAQPVAASLLQRAVDLHEKVGMPWSDAEKLALSEVGIDAAAIDELIGECGGSTLLTTRDDFRDFACAVLVHGSQLYTAAPALTEEPIDQMLHALDDRALAHGDNLPGLALNSRELQGYRDIVRAALRSTQGGE